MRLFILLAMILLTPISAHSISDLGTAGMLGNDLTDLGDDGVEGSYAAPNLAGFDAEFFGDDELGFGGGEFSFNVFDNIAGPTNDKWCCNTADGGDGVHVGADFRNTLLTAPGDLIQLTHFTITSDNDVGITRDPDIWAIQGSLDGILWTDIFVYSQDGDSPFDDFGGDVNLRTLRYDAAADYATPANYAMFRYVATSAVSNSLHAISELEFFGNIVSIPEPEAAWLVWLALVGIAYRRRA